MDLVIEYWWTGATTQFCRKEDKGLESPGSHSMHMDGSPEALGIGRGNPLGADLRGSRNSEPGGSAK